MHSFICIYTNLYIYVYKYTYTFIYIYICTTNNLMLYYANGQVEFLKHVCSLLNLLCKSTQVRIIHVYIYIYVCIHVLFIYIYIYLHIYVYIYNCHLNTSLCTPAGKSPTVLTLRNVGSSVTLLWAPKPWILLQLLRVRHDTRVSR